MVIGMFWEAGGEDMWFLEMGMKMELMLVEGYYEVRSLMKDGGENLQLILVIGRRLT
jgi:hypothetical protein